MNVCSVIVTYGNRFRFLSQVVRACLREGVKKIIVVDNNSVLESRGRLKELEQEEERLQVIYLSENTGSAGGYKRGLQEAIKCKDCEFIWLLDDDNMPKEGALKELLKFWDNLKERKRRKKVALLSFRPDRNIYKEAVLENKPYLLLGRKNSFLGFHFIDLPHKLWRRMRIPFLQKNHVVKSGVVPVAPYGGLFFHKDLLEVIGFPREEFFLYVDDHEWTYRITKFGGKIFVIFDSIIEDIDVSWHLKRRKKFSFLNFLFARSEQRVYYSVRNRVVFERENLVTVSWIYRFNIFFYKFLLKTFCFIYGESSFKNLEVFDKAVKDGLEEALGKNESFDI